MNHADLIYYLIYYFDMHHAHTKEMNHAALIYYFDIHHAHTKEMNHADLNTVSIDAVASINHYSTQRE